MSSFYPFDHCVITAATQEQADVYRQLLDARIRAGLYPNFIQFTVVADVVPNLGSAGAALFALYTWVAEQKKTAEILFSTQRTLLINAGGPMRQLPCYEAEGKLFTPLPIDTSSLIPPVVLDGILTFFLRYPWKRGELVITSADVWLDGTLDNIPTNRQGIWGFARPALASEREAFGMVEFEPGCSRVAKYWPKLPAEKQLKAATLEGSGELALDMGFYAFCPKASLSFYQILIQDDAITAFGNRLLKGKAALNLYKEVLLAALYAENEKEFNKQCIDSGCSLSVADANHLRNCFKKVSLYALLCPQIEFYHLGHLRHVLKAYEKLATARRRLFYTWATGEISPNHIGGVVTFNSTHSEAYQPQPKRVFLENCSHTLIDHPRGDNLFVGLKSRHLSIEIPEGFCIEERHKETEKIVLIYNLGDHFSAMGEDPLFCGQNLSHWLVSRGLKESDVYAKGLSKNLQNAKLFGAWQNELFLAGYFEMPSDPDWGYKFCKLKRYSLHELSSYSALEREKERSAHREKILKERLIQHKGWHQLSNTDFKVISDCMDVKEWKEWATKTQDPILLAYRKQLLDSHDAKSKNMHRPVFMLNVRSALSITNWSIRPGETLWGRSPVRMDLAGGWTDTPPYTLEFGGEVTNVSIDLGTLSPIQIQGRVIPEATFELHNLETGLTTKWKSPDDIHKHKGIGTPESVIAKALNLCGLAPKDLASFKKLLNQLGGGLHIRYGIHLPIGSGLGASSIFAATVLAFLHRALSLSLSGHDLTTLVLDLEQQLGTGAGWQDALGGVYPGVKYMVSSQGAHPDPHIHYLDDHFFVNPRYRNRWTLFYTGTTRSNPGLTEHVIATVLNRSPKTILNLHYLRAIARQMNIAIQERNWNALLGLLKESSEASRSLLPESFNENFKDLERIASSHATVVKHLGAGGGGFVLFASESIHQAENLRVALSEHSKVHGGQIHPLQISATGMNFTLI